MIQTNATWVSHEHINEFYIWTYTCTNCSRQTVNYIRKGTLKPESIVCNNCLCHTNVVREQPDKDSAGLSSVEKEKLKDDIMHELSNRQHAFSRAIMAYVQEKMVKEIQK